MNTRAVLLSIILLAGTGLLQAQQYSQVNASITFSGDTASVRAESEATGFTFLQFPAKVSGSSFPIEFEYMIKSENPSFDPSIFIRVYPREQEISDDWIKTRTKEECYYYTASNGEMIFVGKTPVIKGRLEAYGPSGCIEQDCDYYYENNSVLPIPDGEWVHRTVPVECDNSGTVWIVVEMNKKTLGSIEWNLKNFRVNGEKILFSEEEKAPAPQEQENRTVEKQPPSKQAVLEEEKKETLSMFKKALEYSAVLLLAAVVIALAMLLKKKRAYKRMEVA